MVYQTSITHCPDDRQYPCQIASASQDCSKSDQCDNAVPGSQHLLPKEILQRASATLCPHNLICFALSDVQQLCQKEHIKIRLCWQSWSRCQLQNPFWQQVLRSQQGVLKLHNEHLLRVALTEIVVFVNGHFPELHEDSWRPSFTGLLTVQCLCSIL